MGRSPGRRSHIAVLSITSKRLCEGATATATIFSGRQSRSPSVRRDKLLAVDCFVVPPKTVGLRFQSKQKRSCPMLLTLTAISLEWFRTTVRSQGFLRSASTPCGGRLCENERSESTVVRAMRLWDAMEGRPSPSPSLNQGGGLGLSLSRANPSLSRSALPFRRRVSVGSTGVFSKPPALPVVIDFGLTR